MNKMNKEDTDLSTDSQMDKLEEILQRLNPVRVQQLIDLLEKDDVEQFEELQEKEKNDD